MSGHLVKSTHCTRPQLRPMAIYNYEEVILFQSEVEKICGFHTVWRSKSPLPSSVAFRKDFPHTEKLGIAMRRLKESGVVRRLASKYFTLNTFEKCLNHEKHGLELGYDKLLALFLFLIGFSTVSLISLLVELIVKCLKKK